MEVDGEMEREALADGLIDAEGLMEGEAEELGEILGL
jgi:hypothetical protein